MALSAAERKRKSRAKARTSTVTDVTWFCPRCKKVEKQPRIVLDVWHWCGAKGEATYFKRA